MKKFSIFTLILLSGLALSTHTNAQGFEPGPGFKQVNFGGGTSGWGVVVFGSMDFGVVDKITVGPWVSLRTNSYINAFTGGFRADYHFASHIPALPEELDLWGGAGLGYTNVSDDRGRVNNGTFENTTDGYLDLWVRAGGRWYFSPQWGGMVEGVVSSRGNISGAVVGLSYKF